MNHAARGRWQPVGVAPSERGGEGGGRRASGRPWVRSCVSGCWAQPGEANLPWPRGTSEEMGKVLRQTLEEMSTVNRQLLKEGKLFADE